MGSIQNDQSLLQSSWSCLASSSGAEAGFSCREIIGKCMKKKSRKHDVTCMVLLSRRNPIKLQVNTPQGGLQVLIVRRCKNLLHNHAIIFGDRLLVVTLLISSLVGSLGLCVKLDMFVHMRPTPMQARLSVVPPEPSLKAALCEQGSLLLQRLQTGRVSGWCQGYGQRTPAE